MPKPSLPLNQIIQGNSLNLLETLPAQSVDVIFADPPYNLQLQQELWRPNLSKVDGVDDQWDQFKGFAHYDEFTRAWLQSCRRVLKDTGTLWVIGTYHNIYRVGAILMDLDYWILNDLVWVKTNPMPNFRGVRFTNAHETLLWVQKKKGERYTFNYQVMKALNDDLQMRSDWQIPLCTGNERLKVNGSKAHPTQKPEALLYRVMLSSTNRGDVVLDPFFGTGTTGAVAKRLRRHWIGFEQDATYIELAQARINAVELGPDSEELYQFLSKRNQPRIPFGTLLENGLLRPGQKLYFGQQGQEKATILANGQLKHDTLIGSIHQVGKAIRNGPCNGWEHWYYRDAKTGKRMVIDHLREMMRGQLGKAQGAQ